MAEDPNQDKKNEFEDRLNLVLLPLFNRYILDVRQSIFDGKKLPSRSPYEPDFRYSFDKHYNIVQDYFRNQVFIDGFDPVESSVNAKDIFDEKLSEWRKSSAKEVAAIVTETNVIQAERSQELAETTLTELGSFSKFELAATTAAFLKRSFDARRPVIALTETQAAAESTKILKAESLEESGLSEIYMVIKTWNSLLDGRERATHRAASGQERREGVPFSVGGAALMYPGDITAPPSERINCRCFLTSKVVRIQ